MIIYSNYFKLTRKNIHYEESYKINKTHSCFCVFLSVCYVLVLWAYAQFAAPGEGGNVETVSLNGKVVGVANVGQRFTQDIYFWGRPSCAGDGYDGTSSAGSNKGVTNESYLKEVEARIDTFLLHHPYLKRAEVLQKW